MKSKSKLSSILAFIVILIVVLGGYYLYDRNNKQAKAPSDEEAVSSQDVEENIDSDLGSGLSVPTSTGVTTEAESPKTNGKKVESEGSFSTGTEAEASLPPPDILVVEVSYDGNAFSPQSVDIKVGDIVVFRNKGSQDFRPASDPHPVHTDYPEFDPKTAIAPGGKWQFQFGQAGNWKFHDHLNPSAQGTINVTER